MLCQNMMNIRQRPKPFLTVVSSAMTPNLERVENTTRSEIFLTKLEVFGCPMNTVSSVRYDIISIEPKSME